MDFSQPNEVPEQESFLLQQSRARRLAFWIWGIGLVLSAAVFVKTAPGDSTADPYQLNQDNSKRYEDQLERIGGKSAVLGVEMQDWFTALWHGRKLAYTLATLSVGSGLLCFVFSTLKLHPEPESTRPKS